MTWVKLGPWIPAVLAVGAALAISQGGGQLPKPAFYETAAAIIPILIISLAIEIQAHRLWDRLKLGYKLQVFIYLAIGELAAILAASGTSAATPDAAAQQFADSLEPRVHGAVESYYAAGDAQRVADVLGAPSSVVERAMRLGVDTDAVVPYILEDVIRRNPGTSGPLVGPNQFWSEILAGVTVVSLVCGFLAVLICAFVPAERLPQWAAGRSTTRA